MGSSGLSEQTWQGSQVRADGTGEDSPSVSVGLTRDRLSGLLGGGEDEGTSLDCDEVTQPIDKTD